MFLSCGSLSLSLAAAIIALTTLTCPGYLSFSLSLSVCLFLCAYIIAQDFEALDVGSLCLHLCLIVSPARHLAINQSRQTTAKCRMLEFCKLLGSVPHGHCHWEVSLQCPPSPCLASLPSSSSTYVGVALPSTGTRGTALRNA